MIAVRRRWRPGGWFLRPAHGAGRDRPPAARAASCCPSPACRSRGARSTRRCVSRAPRTRRSCPPTSRAFRAPCRSTRRCLPSACRRCRCWRRSSSARARRGSPSTRASSAGAPTATPCAGCSMSRVDRPIIVSATDHGRRGLQRRRPRWLLEKVPAEVLILRPDPEDHRVDGRDPRRPFLAQTAVARCFLRVCAWSRDCDGATRR